MMNHALKTQKPCVHITPAITGEKARSGFESSAEGTMVDGNVRDHCYYHDISISSFSVEPSGLFQRQRALNFGGVP